MKIYKNSRIIRPEGWPDIDIFRNFAGKGVWILCRDFYNDSTYLQVYEFTDDLVKFDVCMDWEMGQNFHPHKDTGHYLTATPEGLCRTYTIDRPLDVLTADELNELGGRP